MRTIVRPVSTLMVKRSGQGVSRQVALNRPTSNASVDPRCHQLRRRSSCAKALVARISSSLGRISFGFSPTPHIVLDGSASLLELFPNAPIDAIVTINLLRGSQGVG